MSALRSMFVSLLGTTLVILAAGACSAPQASGCTTDQDCKGSRVCRTGACVDPSATDGGTTDGGSTPDDSGMTADAAPGVTCASVGGTQGPNGACFKPCAWDSLSQGHDLTGACKPMGWRCEQYGFTTVAAHCEPALSASCASDSDCGFGWKCTTIYYSATQQSSKTCLPGSCGKDADCPTGGFCLTSCPNKHWSPVPVCIFLKGSVVTSECGGG